MDTSTEPYVIKTERLGLRPATDSDVGPLYQVFSDPQVMKYVGDGTVRSREKVQETIEMWRELSTQGLGLFTVVCIDSKEIIGDCGLIPIKHSGQESRGPEIELGYRLGQKYWGKGFATEAARAAVSYGFESLGLAKIMAVTHLDNQSSRNVLEKVGFQYQGTTDAYYDSMTHLYVLEGP